MKPLSIQIFYAALFFFILPVWASACVRGGDVSISVYETPTINGIAHALTIRGDDYSNPVILYIHGGPGYTMSPFSERYFSAWEKDFTIVQWDQRGAGRTYCANPEYDPSAATFEEFLADAEGVVAYLRDRLDQDKIIILGHSWGSALGIHLIRRRPEWVSAYVGTGQIAYNWEQESAGYRFALREAYARGDEEGIQALEAIKPYPETDDYLEKFHKQREYVIKYGGSLFGGRTYEGFEAEAFALTAQTSDDLECRRIARTSELSAKLLGRLISRNSDIGNLPALGLDFDVPIFFFLGRHDEHTPMRSGAAYFIDIKAPYKRLILFDHAAHAPPLEEPEAFLAALLEHVLPIVKEGE